MHTHLIKMNLSEALGPSFAKMKLKCYYTQNSQRALPGKYLELATNGSSNPTALYAAATNSEQKNPSSLAAV